ncbi:T9SS type A sorting domain-containing protein [Rufibacter psychrotolerans]|uniref:T9SS type A sorting domain-containing protein n=1 Tax=Rufibacter psychrotolerans TaxID=2812556 RepID=UPI0019678DED|nr:YCF48-related protein [Rufibacter sp. SYSU D00308]
MKHSYLSSFSRKLSLALGLALSVQISTSSVAMAQGQATWLERASGFTTPARGIRTLDAVDEKVAWASGYDASSANRPTQEFTRTVDGGNTWVPGVIPGDETAYIGNIHGASATEAWAALQSSKANGNKGVFHTTNGGQTWVKQASAFFNSPTSFINWVTFSDATNGVTGGDPVDGYFELYTTNNGGQNWVRVPQANLPAALPDEYGLTNVFTTTGNATWFGTSQGRVFRSTDQGLTWRVSTPFTTSVHVSSLAFSPNGTGIAIGLEQGTGNLVYARTGNGGASWAPAKSQNPAGIYANDVAYVPGTPSTFVITGVRSGAMGSAYSRDGGASWTVLDNDVQHLEVDFASPTAGWSGGYSRSSTEGGMFTFNASLATTPSGVPVGWVEQTNGLGGETKGFSSLDAVNDQVVWALRYGATGASPQTVPEFVKTTDGGATWTVGQLAGLTNSDAGNIEAISATEAYATVKKHDDANGTGVYHTTNGGVTWTKQATAQYANPASFPNWITFTDATHGVTAGDPIDGYFEIYTTSNGGQNWVRVPQTNMPATLSGEFGLTNDFTKQGNTVWFGTTAGRVYKSTDHGLTWTASAPFGTNVQVTDMAFSPNGTGIVVGFESGTSNLQLAHTTDGGTTWTTPVTEAPAGLRVSGIAHVPGTPATFVITGSSGPWVGSAYSTDAGLTWVVIDQNVQHLEVTFTSPTSGWSGGFNKAFKFSGSLATTLTSSPDQMGESSLVVYPNPATSEITVVGSTLAKGARVLLYNVSGQLVLDQLLPEQRHTLSVGHLPKGLYMLQLIEKGAVTKRKVVLR